MTNLIKLKDIIRPVHTIPVASTLEDAVRVMLEKHSNSLFAVDAEGKLVGIVTILDILREITPDYLENRNVVMSAFVTEDMFIEDVRKCRNTPLANFMETNTPTIEISESIIQAILLAISNERSRVAVIDDDGKPIGMITRTEIKAVIGDYLDIPDSLAGV